MVISPKLSRLRDITRLRRLVPATQQQHKRNPRPMRNTRDTRSLQGRATLEFPHRPASSLLQDQQPAGRSSLESVAAPAGHGAREPFVERNPPLYVPVLANLHHHASVAYTLHPTQEPFAACSQKSIGHRWASHHQPRPLQEASLSPIWRPMKPIGQRLARRDAPRPLLMPATPDHPNLFRTPSERDTGNNPSA